MPHKEHYDLYPYVIVAKSDVDVLWYWAADIRDWVRDPDRASGWTTRERAGQMLRSDVIDRYSNARVADIRCTDRQLKKLVIERTMPDQSVWYLKISKIRWTGGTLQRYTHGEWTSNINDVFDHNYWNDEDLKKLNGWLKRLYGDGATLVKEI